MRLLQIATVTAILTAAPAVLAADALPAPFSQWTDGKTLEVVRGSKHPFATWKAQDGMLQAEGTAGCWSTRLVPGDQGTDTRVTVRFQVSASSGQVYHLPKGFGYQRWHYHWEENVPGYDVGVVLRWKDALNFYRVQLSAHRGELALWDSSGGFLQCVPCKVDLDKPHTLVIDARGPHFTVKLDGKPVMDYWDRTLPHTGGQVGLSVWKSKVEFDKVEVERLAAESTRMPAHKPNFRFEQHGKHMIMYDGHEPISRYYKVERDKAGTLFQDQIKFKPGYRASYYTWLGPGIKPGPGHGVLALAGEFPKAFDVQEEGKELRFVFRTERAGAAVATHTALVRYDPKREVYRYEYRVNVRFTHTKPYKLHTLEMIDPLTFNNRKAGPDVVHRWQWAEHAWHVYEGPERTWERYPLIDYLAECGNQPTYWGKFTNFLYPDPAACPAFEVDLGWKQGPKREFLLGLCHWGYDFHHTSSGLATEIPIGHERTYGITLTALPPSEAERLYKKSEPSPKVAKSETVFVNFNAAGNTFAEFSTRTNPTSTMVWQAGEIDETVGRKDNCSLRLDGPAKGFVRMYQYAIEQNATQWWARGWYKATGVTGRGLQLRIKYAYAKKPEQVFYLDGRGDTDWTYFSVITDSLKQRDCTDITFELDGSGQVWIDDFAISALKPGETPKTTRFPLPPGMEPRTDVLIDLPMNAKPGRGVYDASHNGQHLLLFNGTRWAREEGRGFLRLDGVDDRCTIPIKPVLSPKQVKTPVGHLWCLFPFDAFTYEMWFRPQEPMNKRATSMSLWHFRWGFVVSLRNYDPKTRTWKLAFNNNRRQPQDHYSPTEKVGLTHRVPAGQWTHMVATHDDTHVTLYVNGKEIARKAFNQKSFGFEFTCYQNQYHVGSYYAQQQYYRGDIGPIRLYTKSLSAAEVAERFGSGWPKK